MKFLCKLFGHSKKGIWVDKGNVYYANAIDVEPTRILYCISCPRCGFEYPNDMNDAYDAYLNDLAHGRD